jgi:GR25 family glycosyltransferase involved in LPS biosynthesis
MICFNTKYWPLVYFYKNDTKMNETAFEDYKKTYLQILLKCKKEKCQIILISDLNNQNKLDIKYVMKQAYFNLKIEKFNKKYVKTVCVYMNDKNFKKILDMYFSVCPPYCPYKICETYEVINQFIKETNNEVYNTSIFSNLEINTINLEQNDEEYKKIKEELKKEIEDEMKTKTVNKKNIKNEISV